jgi:hypothetical protein
VTVRTVSGSVLVRAFAGLDTSLDLRSMSSHVSCDLPLTIVEQSHNRLQARIDQGGVPFEIHTDQRVHQPPKAVGTHGTRLPARRILSTAPFPCTFWS